MLLIAIAMVVIRISGIYNKGITMKSVNQAGQAIVDDMKRVVGASGPFALDLPTWKQSPTGLNPPDKTTIDGGRLCTGAYSYVWNIGTHMTNHRNKYRDDPTDIRFIRVNDNGRSLCSSDRINEPIDKAAATELLSEHDLAIQEFNIESRTGTVTGTALYEITMLISNADGDAISTRIDTLNQCKAPDEDGENQNFCAVNEFKFTVRAGGAR